MIEEAVYQIAINHVGLRALIGGAAPATRIFPAADVREHAMPHVVYEKHDPAPVAGIYQDSGWYHTRFTFTAYAPTSLLAKQVIEQVRAAYQRYFSGGVVVAGTVHKIDDVKATDSGGEYYDAELDAFAEEIELEFFHN
jgi:hypothetical protein